MAPVLGGRLASLCCSECESKGMEASADCKKKPTQRRSKGEKTQEVRRAGRLNGKAFPGNIAKSLRNLSLFIS